MYNPAFWLYGKFIMESIWDKIEVGAKADPTLLKFRFASEMSYFYKSRIDFKRLGFARELGGIRFKSRCSERTR